MPDYADVCEERGRKRRGRGCTNKVMYPDGLRGCALRGGSGSCTARNVDDPDSPPKPSISVLSVPDTLFASTRFRFSFFRSDAGEYTTTFDIRGLTNEGVGKKYWVSPNGNNANSGAMNAPFADLSYAVTRPDVDNVEIIGLTGDFIAYGSRGWNNARPSRTISVTNNTGFRYVSVGSVLTTPPAWTATAGRANVYQITIAATSFNRVCDAIPAARTYPINRRTNAPNTNVPTHFMDYKLAASLDDCTATAGTYYYDAGNGIGYVHPYDNRNLVGDGWIIPSGSVVSAVCRAANVSGMRIYGRNLDFVGGGNAAYIDILNAASTTAGDFEYCTFQQAATGNSFSSVGAETNLYRCNAAYPIRDNYNYHAGGANTDVPATWVEVECGSVGSGAGAQGPSDNESTAHENCYGISYKCAYAGGDDNVVSDVNSATRWMIDTTVGQPASAGMAVLQVGNDARMFLDAGYYQPGAGLLARTAENGKIYTRNVAQVLPVAAIPF